MPEIETATRTSLTIEMLATIAEVLCLVEPLNKVKTEAFVDFDTIFPTMRPLSRNENIRRKTCFVTEKSWQ